MNPRLISSQNADDQTHTIKRPDSRGQMEGHLHGQARRKGTMSLKQDPPPRPMSIVSPSNSSGPCLSRALHQNTTRLLRPLSFSIVPWVARTSLNKQSLSIGLYRKKLAPASNPPLSLVRGQPRHTDEFSRLTDSVVGGRKIMAEFFTVFIPPLRLHYTAAVPRCRVAFQIRDLKGDQWFGRAISSGHQSASRG